MTGLHEHFKNRNQHEFRRLLDGSAERARLFGHPHTGTIPGKSKSCNRLTTEITCNVNARDARGRTVLHLACSDTDGTEYVRLLLRHPSVDVNVLDRESAWTPLHRALYSGNISSALLLLKRSDTDQSLKDYEGYSAFDLYNSTLEGTKPDCGTVHAQLYTWGANRNAVLGLGDADDRAIPDQVIIEKKDDESTRVTIELAEKLSPVLVRQIQLSRLHTAVVTSEAAGNLRLCGFGSGGRLGPGQHTQYKLKPLSQFNQTIISVALGQDHTLALTKTAEVLSWGLNRFSQLGYVLDNPTGRDGFAKVSEEPIQTNPRKISALKKVAVRGVAASKSASACWTDEHVYTWGTNNGQLGYLRTSEPQILPRIATWVIQSVLGISLTDSVMACLLTTGDVICVENDRHLKINFPAHSFPPEIQVYRRFLGDKIVKITSCEDTFAALSLKGELFTFSSTPGDTTSASTQEKTPFKPQRVWALRRSFNPIKDVALGSDGSMIVCTESGHVLTRARVTKPGQNTTGKAFKFLRQPQLQRITQVCANSTGAFAALRVEFQPDAIRLQGNSLGEDLATIQPFLLGPPSWEHRGLRRQEDSSDQKHDDEADVPDVEKDINGLGLLLDVLDFSYKHQTTSSAQSFAINHGADVVLHMSSGNVFLCHKIILSARSKRLREVFDESAVIKSHNLEITMETTIPSPQNGSHFKISHLAFKGFQPISGLLLLVFLYSDELLALWDRHVAAALDERLKALKVDPSQVKKDLCAFSEMLELPTLAFALDSPSKRKPTPSLGVAMHDMFQSAQACYRGPSQSLSSADIILRLADKDVFCHSAILRARSIFFSNFFAEEDWTIKRWRTGTLAIDMRHLHWRVMKYVFAFMYWDAEDSFNTVEFATSVDEVLEFTFEVMAAATELLLDRLVLLCSAVVLKYLNLHNACYIVTEALHFSAEQLMERVQNFLVVNMELLLETGMLDDMSPALITSLSNHVKAKQRDKSPVVRSGQLITQTLLKHADWLASQPISSSQPSTPVEEFITFVGTSPKARKEGSPASIGGTPQPSPVLAPQKRMRRPPSNDIFVMDDADVLASLKGQGVDEQFSPLTLKPSVPPAWKATIVPKVDMRAVMAEAATVPSKPPLQKLSRSPPASSTFSGTTWSPGKQRSRNTVDATAAGSSSQPIATSSPSRPVLPATPPSARTLPSISSESSSPSGKRPTLGSPPGRPGLGPIFTPVKQTNLSSSAGSPSTGAIRCTSSGKAWTQPNPALPVTTTGMSLVAIQQLELEQIAGSEMGKEKRSLREIQEEERARQQEENFLAWWAAEEERIRAENEVIAGSLITQALEGDMSSQPTASKSVKGRRYRKTQPPRKKADHVENKQDQATHEVGVRRKK